MESTPSPIFVQPQVHFPWYDYTIFVLILVGSMGIGVFYGFFGTKNKTNEEFLMAGRSMGVLPVTFSLICSYVSAVVLIGYPVEVYLYGTQYMMRTVGFVLLTIILAYIYVPFYFRLRLTSAYEYFEWRFSRRVRVLCSLSAIGYMLISMPAAVFAPCLALDRVAGMNMYIASATMFLVCIAYSSLGGLKAVLWTDTLQGVVMLVSFIAIIVAGIIEVGGVNEIIRRNEVTNRIEFFNFDVDPRTRHTFWTTIIGGAAAWLQVYGATQAQIQRYNSVPTLAKARKSLLWNMVGLICVSLFTSWIGMTLYAKYFDCDPVSAQIIHSPDELLPLFVMEVLGKYPGLPGIFVGGLTAATLSTLSSALNAIAATVTEDFVKFYRPDLTEQRLTIISKTISVVSGIIAFGLFFPVAAVNDTIQVVPLGTLLAGCLLAPVLGVYTLGMFFPWVNEIGVMCGFVASVGLSLFQGLGQNLALSVPGKLPDQRLYLTTEGCEVVNGTRMFYNVMNTDPSEYVNNWKERDDSLLIQFWSISYSWLPGIGIGTTILVGLICSLIVNCFRKEHRLVESRLLSTPLLKLWQMLLSQKHLRNWVTLSEEETAKIPNYGGTPGNSF